MPGLLYETNVGVPPQEMLEPRPQAQQGLAAAGATVPMAPTERAPVDRSESKGSVDEDEERATQTPLTAAAASPPAAGGVTDDEDRRNINLGSIFAGDEDEEPQEQNSSVKLGIGDFVFYSVLVAKASESGFATLASCFLVVLAGLGGTLLLLAIYQRALPALPLSIALGVFFFVTTSLIIVPYVEAVASVPVYA
uniref:Presenilin n=2 Tax=Phaeomonas parva TaxID=124430 RepID=A0A7S1U0N7_9STRA|mmetsp:Transcript_25725/g.80550  ORF Transcript_25725/g.80550 Transcript_25725/m.80550 type:complete len:195 (+) Transcript_25725:33-617(+)